MEEKILSALEQKMADMAKYDADRQAEYDSYMEQAKIQTSEYWKKDLQHSAEWALGFQKHGYEFIDGWKNVISKAMYNRLYSEWHSAQAGKYKGTGHPAYMSTELTPEEKDKVYKVYQGLVKQGYLKLSKSGKMATFVKPKKK